MSDSVAIGVLVSHRAPWLICIWVRL